MKFPPRSVFLESTALFEVGSRLQTPEFAKLLELRDILKFELLVSEVTLLEYIRQRADIIDELAGDVRSIGDRIAGWGLDSSPMQDMRARLDVLKKELQAFYKRKVEEVGIRVVPLPNVDSGRLLTMAIGRIAPFEEAKADKTEKGFRDALIMFTILNEISSKPDCQTLVVTKDALLGKGLTKHCAEFETELSVVASLDEAVTYIYDRIDKLYWQRLFNESELAKKKLEQYRDAVNDQVQKQVSELTEFDLGIGPSFLGLGRGKVLDVGESVAEVQSLSLDDFKSAIWKDKEQPVSRILFRACCIAHVITSTSQFYGHRARSFGVGRGKPDGPTFLELLGPRPTQRDRRLPISLYGEVRLRETDGGEKLIGVKIDKNQPNDEEAEILWRIPTELPD